MFKTNPARTWLTILGMGVGTSAVVILVGLGFGLQGILLEQIVFGETLLSVTVSNPASQIVVLDDTHIADLQNVDNVKDVSPLASFPALMTLEGLTGNVVLQGIKPSYFRYAGIAAVEGELFKEGEEQRDQNSVLLSAAALKLFDVDVSEVIGKTVHFRVLVPRPNSTANQEVELTKEYHVKGITNEEASISAMIPLYDFLLLIERKIVLLYSGSSLHYS